MIGVKDPKHLGTTPVDYSVWWGFFEHSTKEEESYRETWVKVKKPGLNSSESP